MKRLFLSLLTGIAALCGSAQTKDSVDVSQFTVVYDYACKTRMGKTGENITDTMRLAVQVGTKLNRMMDEMGIKDYELVKNIPIRHKTDQEWREWAIMQKQAHPQYDWKQLFNILADEGVDGTDLHDKWHIVKEVYGVK